jgi:hypothetical protein
MGLYLFVKVYLPSYVFSRRLKEKLRARLELEACGFAAIFTSLKSRGIAERPEQGSSRA